MSIPRHRKGTQLALHSCEWVVRWLEKNGWQRGGLYVPTRKEILSGDPNPGHQYMTKVGAHGKAVVKVPGAVRPRERLSRHEWRMFMADLSAEYYLLGMDVPGLSHRL